MIGWWRRWIKQRDCFHHDHRTGTTWIRAYGIIDGGRKAWVCDECDQLIIT